jgi:hypothetical protein
MGISTGGHDIAVLPFERIPLQDSQHEAVALHLGMFLEKEDLSQLGIGPGENIFMVDDSSITMARQATFRRPVSATSALCLSQ